MSNNSLSENIANVLSIARLAPSVHNTQPWCVTISGNSLIISRNSKHSLTYGDPTGRQTQLSMGIFTESCVIALHSLGFKVLAVSIDASSNIIINVEESKTTSEEPLAEALRHRFTDRSVYIKTVVDQAVIANIENSWVSDTVKLKVVTDEVIIGKCATLTEKGLRLAFSSPDFRNELSDYIVKNNKTKFGIPMASLRSNIKATAIMKALIRSGITRKHESNLELDRWNSASALVFVLATGDTPDYWLESGRAYLRASLAIQQSGLRQATSAALVEASDFHEDIEKLLGTSMRIQALMRIGKSDAKPYFSGRFDASEILVT